MSKVQSQASSNSGLSKLLILTIAGLSLQASAHPVSAVLRLQEKVPMESLAQVVRSGNSPMAGTYSAEDIRQISAPDDQEYDALVANLKSEGFELVNESKTHLWITVKADSSVFERVFSTKLALNEHKERHAMKAPVVPSHLSLIAAVNGLNSVPRFSHLQFHPNSGLSQSPSIGLMPNQIRTIYSFNGLYSEGLSGQGQHVAVATYGDINLQVVQKYYQTMGLNPMPTVDKVNFNGAPTLDDDAAGETSLDAEMIGMIAPGAAVHIFTSASNDDTGEMAMFTAILDDGREHVVNYSWGGCEVGLNSQHAAEMGKIFARAVAQGTNILVASGDNGSDACNNHTVAADWPGDHPDIVAVGGTSLQRQGASFDETAWTGSGGGISKIFAVPSWQRGLGVNKRAYPDVAFNADPQHSPEPIYIQTAGKQGWAAVGGTSMATPQWAGFLALVNMARAGQGKSALPFLNPIIYGMGSQNRANTFNDVTSGSNGAFSAGVGYDEVTGWGSMNALNLAQLLVNQ